MFAIDWGGNFSRLDGALQSADAPPSFRRELDRLFLDSALPAELEQTARGEAALSLDRLPKRGQVLYVITCAPGALVDGVSSDANRAGESTDGTSPEAERATEADAPTEAAPAQGPTRGPAGWHDATAEIQLALFEVFQSDDPEPGLDQIRQHLLDGGYFVDRVTIFGPLWESVRDLHETRDRILGEWVEQRVVASARSETCRPCHSEAFEGWQARGTHARAWASLAESEAEDPTRNAFCVPCHTTGLGVEDLIAREISVQEQHRNVQCTACHVSIGAHGAGPGLTGHRTRTSPSGAATTSADGSTSSSSSCDLGMRRAGLEACLRCHGADRGDPASWGEGLRAVVGCVSTTTTRPDNSED